MTQEDLGSFPELPPLPDRVFARIHNSLYGSLHFCNSGVGRFDLPAKTGNGTCYVSLRPIGAFVEVFGRFTTVTREMIDERSLSELTPSRPLRLADLTNRQVLGGFGITGDISTGADYGPSQKWALRLFNAGFEGIHYVVRHDPSHIERSVAVFGNEESTADLFDVNTGPIPRDLIEEACREFGFRVWPSAALE